MCRLFRRKPRYANVMVMGDALEIVQIPWDEAIATIGKENLWTRKREERHGVPALPVVHFYVNTDGSPWRPASGWPKEKEA